MVEILVKEGGGITLFFFLKKKKKKTSDKVPGTMLDKHLDEAQRMIEYQREL